MAFDKNKIENMLEMVDEFIFPMLQRLTEGSQTPWDNYAVAFLKGGLEAVLKEMEKEGNSQTQ